MQEFPQVTVVLPRRDTHVQLGLRERVTPAGTLLLLLTHVAMVPRVTVTLGRIGHTAGSSTGVRNCCPGNHRSGLRGREPPTVNLMRVMPPEGVKWYPCHPLFVTVPHGTQWSRAPA
ncbi:hypothetical protein GCM10025781_01270 [Kocuria gwangalliensis]|uniref:Uncharacterized protein n=1 Tax=Kocuria gwangalliensis TaxID=501592 RepID=A0ABP8WFD2_9MICC